jgi:hypothetical protein
MKRQNFSVWLVLELDAARQTLLALLEQQAALLSQAEQAAVKPPRLSEAERRALQTKYRRIIWDLHPQRSQWRAEPRQALYRKAASAYMRQDLAAMDEVCAALFPGEDPASYSPPEKTAWSGAETTLQQLMEYLAADDLPAADPGCPPAEPDDVLLRTIRDVREQAAAVERELAQAKTSAAPL